LKQIVSDLIPLRSSKLLTRTYFNTHLRLSSNQRDYSTSEPDDDLPFEFHSQYERKPEEYKWNSDLLQPALLDILKVDEYSFGYVVNYLNEDIAYRRKQKPMRGSKISDSLVKFSIQFDIDEIRAKAKAIPDFKARLLYLNEVDTDFRIFEGLSQDEEEWIAEPIGQSIKALQEEAETEMKLVALTQSLSEDARSDGRNKSERNKRSLGGFNPARGMLYDFSITQTEKYKPLAIPLLDGWDASAGKNASSFSFMLNRLFETCYNNDKDFEMNEAVFNYTPRWIGEMMLTYATSLKQEHHTSDRVIMRKLYIWVDKTYGIVTRAYEATPKLIADYAFEMTEYGEVNKEASTEGLKHVILREMFASLQALLDDLIPEKPDYLDNVVPYNLWGNGYDSLLEEYSKQFGLEYKKRAVVRVKENKELFRDILIDNCIRFCNQMESTTPFGGEPDYKEQMSNTIEEKFHESFRDYHRRLLKISSSKDDIDAAILVWIAELSKHIYFTYCSEHLSVEAKFQNKYYAALNTNVFFFDICSKVTTDIAQGYFVDYDTLSLIPDNQSSTGLPTKEKEEIGTPPAPAVEAAAVPDNMHDKTIDYSSLYGEWNGKAFTNISFDEFKYAIDKADFKTMLNKATAAGTRRGFIGGVKFIMRSLRDHLGQQWYREACFSIDEDENSVNKLNDGTTAIKKINIKIIKDYIQ